MEKALIKMARQLRSLDEASLMSMWDKYAEIVRDFEPSERWEEAVLVLSFIQSARMKNQLFNHHWANVVRARDTARHEPLDPGRAQPPILSSESGEASSRPRKRQALTGALRDKPGRPGCSCVSSGSCGPGDPCCSGDPRDSRRPGGSDVGPTLGNGQGKRGKLIRLQARDKR